MTHVKRSEFRGLSSHNLIIKERNGIKNVIRVLYHINIPCILIASPTVEIFQYFVDVTGYVLM